jgi:hypothetical protein
MTAAPREVPEGERRWRTVCYESDNSYRYRDERRLGGTHAGTGLARREQHICRSGNLNQTTCCTKDERAAIPARCTDGDGSSQAARPTGRSPVSMAPFMLG